MDSETLEDDKLQSRGNGRWEKGNSKVRQVIWSPPDEGAINDEHKHRPNPGAVCQRLGEAQSHGAGLRRVILLSCVVPILLRTDSQWWIIGSSTRVASNPPRTAPRKMLPVGVFGMHRDDIDGLRTFAVLPVIAFHFTIFPLISGGGFVGVDIFFVISGYLITRTIYQDINNGT